MPHDPLEMHRAAIERVLSRVVSTWRCRDTDDLEQELRVFLVEHGPNLLARFTGRSAFETYITSALRRQAVTWWRRHQRGSDRFAGLDAADRIAQPATELQALLDAERGEREDAAICVALATLDAPDREFFVRAALHAEPMHDLARAFGMTRAAAYSRFHRLLRKVRRLAAEALESDPIRSDPIRSDRRAR